IQRSAMEAVADSPGRYLWSQSGISPGKYRVDLDEASLHAELVVPPAGLTGARVEALPPCDVDVRCVDDDTNQEALVESVELARDENGVLHWFEPSGAWDPSARRWRLRAPIGRMRITAKAKDSAGTAEAELHAGMNELELRLARHIGLVPLLYDGRT